MHTSRTTIYSIEEEIIDCSSAHSIKPQTRVEDSQPLLTEADYDRAIAKITELQSLIDIEEEKIIAFFETNRINK